MLPVLLAFFPLFFRFGRDPDYGVNSPGLGGGHEFHETGRIVSDYELLYRVFIVVLLYSHFCRSRPCATYHEFRWELKYSMKSMIEFNVSKLNYIDILYIILSSLTKFLLNSGDCLLTVGILYVHFKFINRTWVYYIFVFVFFIFLLQ